MQTINKTTRPPTLITQIEFYKNYSQHRKRVQSTFQRPPLKKSISYDQHKHTLHQYLKNRKEYTSHYNRKEIARYNQLRDSKMLQNILDYDSKMFVFSLNKHPITNSTLHHNSIVATNKKNQCIDQENEKLHFRITKAKSLYSHLSPYKFYAASTRQFYQLPDKRQRFPSHQLNTDIYNQQLSPDQVFTRSNQFQSEYLHHNHPPNDYRNPSSLINQLKLHLLRSQFSQPSRKICERVRRQKLAEKLYEKKQKFQKSILSKIKTQS